MSCDGCSRTFLLIFNVIFTLSGLGLIGLSIANFVNYWDIATVANDHVSSVGTILLLVAGLITTLSGLLGFCGTTNEHRPTLLAFFVFLLIIFGFEVAAGVYTAVNRASVQTRITQQLALDIQSRYDPAHQGLQRALNHIQRQFKCCGVDSYRDWANTTWGAGKTIPEPVPDSCCKVYVPGCGLDTRQRGVNLTGINLGGCSGSISQTASDNAYVILGVGVGIGALQVLGMILSMLLYCELRYAEDDD